MTGLIAAEIRKLRSVRSTWILSIIGWLLVGMNAAPGVFGAYGEDFTGSGQQVADAIGSIGGTSIIVLVVGLLAMTTEFRHGTIGRTLQITPSRIRVLVAKFVAGSAYTVVFVLGSLVAVGAVLLLGVVIYDVGLTLNSLAFEAGWQSLVALVLTVLFGVAFGALVRAQVVAIVVAMVWIMIVENLFAALLPTFGRWLPFQALSGLFIPDGAADQMQMPGGTFVPLAGFTALLVFTAWVVTFTTLAAILLRRRDV